jgi:hypothetical protein
MMSMPARICQLSRLNMVVVDLARKASGLFAYTIVQMGGWGAERTNE